MDNKEALNTLTDIRNIMERSTKFRSFSGLAAILVGLYATIITSTVFLFFGEFRNGIPTLNIDTEHKLNIVVWIALTLFVTSLVTTFALSYKKAPKPFKIDAPIRRLLWSFSLPLLIGGILCYSMLLYNRTGMTSTIMLLFYGLALINASTHTYTNVRYLGYVQLALGLLDSFIPGYALIFWVLGFGVAHIVYGIVFYIKYDKCSK